MTTQTWKPGITGDWFTASNWESDTVPETGDIALIGSGTPEITSNTIVGEHIILGGSPTGSPVTLVANSVTFEPQIVAGKVTTDQTLTVTAGDASSPVNATLLSQGSTSYEGQMIVEAFRGTLEIDAESSGNAAGDFSFVNTAGDTFVLVTQESALHFAGEQITTAGIIEVEGSVDIAAGVNFGGQGIAALDSGGHVSIEGGVLSGQQIDFADGTGSLVLTNPQAFSGVLGFTVVGGDRIDLPGVQAKSEAVLKDKDTLTLTLYSGPHQTGTVLAQLNVQSIDQESLNPTKRSCSPATILLSAVTGMEERSSPIHPKVQPFSKGHCRSP